VKLFKGDKVKNDLEEDKYDYSTKPLNFDDSEDDDDGFDDFQDSFSSPK